MEVCASKTVIVGQHCAYYDTESNFIRPNFHQPCEKHMNPCPDVYISSSTFTYQECYEDNRSGRTFNIIPNPPMLMQNDDKLLNYITTVICAVVLVLSLSVLLLQIVCLRRCYLHFKCFLKKMQKRKHARKMEEDEESDEFIEDISRTMLPGVLKDLERTDEKCMSGFYGFEPLCKKCPFPSYGPGCQRICACENKTCNHITGCFESISDIDAVWVSKKANRLRTSETRFVDTSVADYEGFNTRSSPKPVSRTTMTQFASGLMIASVVIGCVGGVLLFIHFYLFILPSGRCKKPDRSSVLFYNK